MSSTEQLRANRHDYIGLFLLIMATIAFEILLTRIFSVTLWYHFAFMAISIAMFGMTLGALIVQFNPKLFVDDNIRKWLSISSLALAVTIVLSFIIHFFCMNFFAAGQTEELREGLREILAVTYVVVAIPFLFSGIGTCVALTKFPLQVGKLYATDLAGASVGCLFVIALLAAVDGPTAILVVATLAAIASAFFAQAGKLKSCQLFSILVAVGLSVASVSNAALATSHQQFFRIKSAQHDRESQLLYEKWNCFSRITVLGDPAVVHRPYAWGLSSTWPENKRISELMLIIDSIAGTVLTKFTGDWNKVEYLKCDVTNLAHILRHDANVLVVGVGGGRDILSALAFNQKSITGVEINYDILNTLTKVFGDYTGHLELYPQVKLVNDEARCFIDSSKDKYDIIEISLVDTSAASAAGAFVLTEHSLYTTQAWETFLNHMTRTGVLSVSRWYFKQSPVELYRLESLAIAALRKAGVSNPRDNIFIVAHTEGASGGRAKPGIATVLISKEPFSKEDIIAVANFADRQHFATILSPSNALDPVCAKLANAASSQSPLSDLAENIAPPTDDNPFFFFFLKPADLFNWNFDTLTPQFGPNNTAIVMLRYLTIFILVLVLGSILIPLILLRRFNSLQYASPLLLYFASIGLGFMFIEISQVHRLIIFLGHPIYGLSVVLFTLLLASGIGSLSTSIGLKFDDKARLYVLLFVLLLFGSLTPAVITTLRSANTMIRIGASVAIMFPLGFFMGMCFPIGMKLANQTNRNLAPWLWGVNGATSVSASVLAVVIAISFGITASFWTGAACYLVAVMAFLFLNGKKTNSASLGQL